MQKIAIKVEGVSKAYRIGRTYIKSGDTFIAVIKSFLTKPASNFRKIKGLSNISESNISDDGIYMALDNVSFQLNEGEVLGIIGKNGAGKSTLLKILSRIVKPTLGRIEMYGRVASLLEVGTGFNPDLTGRENVYLNGTILGLTKKEIDARYDSIVDFSGIGQFIETPVKRYSSGMKVRLAFAVAAHLDPEILIIDEVLAVGDAEFQQKCISKMQDVANKQGRTVLFVSHDMAAVKKLCTRAILLHKGKLVMEGLPEEVIEHYYTNIANAQASMLNVLNKDNRAFTDNRFTIEGYELIDEKGNIVQSVESGSNIVIRLYYKTTIKGYNPVVLLRIKNNMDQVLFNCLSRNSYGQVMTLKSEGYIDCHIPKLPLLAGLYTIDTCLKYQSETTDEILSGIRLQVERGDFFGTGKMNEDYINGMVIQHSWEVN